MLIEKKYITLYTELLTCDIDMGPNSLSSPFHGTYEGHLPTAVCHKPDSS